MFPEQGKRGFAMSTRLSPFLLLGFSLMTSSCAKEVTDQNERGSEEVLIHKQEEILEIGLSAVSKGSGSSNQTGAIILQSCQAERLTRFINLLGIRQSYLSALGASGKLTA
jgi:hypothetical protein